MKKTFKLFTVGIISALILTIACPFCSQAAGKPQVYETIVNENTIVLYAGEFDSQPKVETAQIGNRLIEDVNVSSLTAERNRINTLLMLDNSFSISKNDREKSITFLSDYIENADKDENIRIALFDEHINYLTEYTTDKTALQNAVSTIEFNDQETYLTDVLYEALNEIRNTEDAYIRVVVISDGVDNKAIGITEKELDKAIEETEVQIFSIGCKKNNNNEELKAMYALARNTNGKDFTLSDYTNPSEISNEIHNSVDKLYSFELAIPEDIKDGLKAGVQIVLSDGNTISKEINMPFGEANSVASSDDSKQEKIDDNIDSDVQAIIPVTSPDIDEGTTETAKENNEVPGKKSVLVPLIVLLCILLLVIGVYISVIRGNNRKKKSNIEKNSNAFAKDNGGSFNSDEDSKTVFEDDRTQFMDNESDETVIYGNSQTGGYSSQTITLTEVNNPNERYSCALKDSIIVGRKHTDYGMVINLDYSISKRHCKIFRDKGKIYIQDLNSTNGTFINENSIIGSCEIHSGDKVKLGRVEFLIEF